MKNKLSKLLFATVMATSASAALASGTMPLDGFYAGLEAGWVNGDAKWIYGNGNPTRPKTQDVDGAIGGAILGYQKRFDKVVLGVEASYNFGEIDGSATCPNRSFKCNVDDVDELFMIGPKLGYMINNNWLVYLHGGYASAEIHTNATNGVINNSTSERHHGWSAGVGVDYAFTNRFRLGFKYSHIDLSRENHTQTQFGPSDNRKITPKFEAFGIRLNYTFQ